MPAQTAPRLPDLLQAALERYGFADSEKKVSFLPLENASVEIIQDKKHIFTVRDKFKTITFKSGSKEDMIGW